MSARISSALAIETMATGFRSWAWALGLAPVMGATRGAREARASSKLFRISFTAGFSLRAIVGTRTRLTGADFRGLIGIEIQPAHWRASFRPNGTSEHGGANAGRYMLCELHT